MCQVLHLSSAFYTGDMSLKYRPLGSTGSFSTKLLQQVNPERSVYILDMGMISSFEYYVTDDAGLVWPAGAPADVQTVVVV